MTNQQRGWEVWLVVNKVGSFVCLHLEVEVALGKTNVALLIHTTSLVLVDGASVRC